MGTSVDGAAILRLIPQVVFTQNWLMPARLMVILFSQVLSSSHTSVRSDLKSPENFPITKSLDC